MEPDYRFSLANERTLLAWVRTGGVLVLLGAVTAWSGYRRFLATDRAMRAGEPIAAPAAPRGLAAALAVISLVILALLAVNELR
jgi:putative membrane protein